MASPSPSPSSPPTSDLTGLPTANVSAIRYNSGNTMLCKSAVSTYISAINSWTTFTPATCSYNKSLADPTDPSSTLAISSTGIATASLQGSPLPDVSTVTEYSRTGSTTTVTGSLSTNSQTSNAARDLHGFGASGAVGLGWILYFGFKIFHR